jgi:uracil-DNA glycosylase family 4
LQSGYRKKFNKEMANSDWELLFFTVAELFCRSGRLFRGNDNFDAEGITLSLPFLKRQIETVKPKAVLTLGDMALKQIVLALDIPLEYKTLTQFINSIKNKKYFIHNDIIIIPSFHPAAHVDLKLIYDRIGMVWQFV